MSVYIKGMEMPTDCFHCRFAVDGWCYAYGKPNIDALANDGRTNFCPLLPVPNHGRLIDADAMLKEHYSGSNDGKYIEKAGVINPLLVERLPTIIPADKEAGE